MSSDKRMYREINMGNFVAEWKMDEGDAYFSGIDADMVPEVEVEDGVPSKIHYLLDHPAMIAQLVETIDDYYTDRDTGSELDYEMDKVRRVDLIDSMEGNFEHRGWKVFVTLSLVPPETDTQGEYDSSDLSPNRILH